MEVAEEVGTEGAEGLVTLTEAGYVTAEIETLVAEERSVSWGAVSEIVPGQVEFDPSRVALVSPRSGGRLERLTVVEGESVDQDQIVAYVLSTAYLLARSDYLQAARRRDTLAPGLPGSDEAQALVDAAARRLLLLGGELEWIEEETADSSTDLLPIRAPFAGRIVETHVLVGAAVEPGSPVFTLADLSVVDVAARVPERTLANLRVGQQVRVTLSAFPGREWTGQVQRIKDELDRETRTATALIRVGNADGRFRPGMFASIHLGLPPDPTARLAVVVPEGAVVTDGSDQYVFVEVGPRSYERRAVEIEIVPGEEGWILLLAGVEAGETVVIRGAFTLKAELAKEGFGDVD